MEEQYKTEKKDGFVYVWHASGIGLRFREGETLQRYLSEIIVPNDFTLSESGLDRVGIVADELREEAAKLFPREFEKIKC